MKRAVTVILYTCLCTICLAQQRPQHTQYFQNNFLLNPAVAGIENYIDVRSSYRTQWVGMEGAPTTFYTSIHTALNKNDRNASRLSMRSGVTSGSTTANKNNRYYVKPHHGIGAIAQMDKAGLLKTFSLNLNYAYHIPITKDLNLSSGLNAGLLQYRLNKQALNLQTPNDPFIAGEIGNTNKFDLGVGIWLYSRNFYMGLSGMQLLSGENAETGGGPLVELQKHYYATGGVRLGLSELVTLTPSVMVKMAENGETMVDLNAKTIYREHFWVGASYRHKDAFAGMVGLFLNHVLDVSYSYDMTTSDVSRVSANSHEVVVGFKLNNPQKVICPQWIW
jgi:type IX secretion system PorP/SprF family membrane protein